MRVSSPCRTEPMSRHAPVLASSMEVGCDQKGARPNRAPHPISSAPGLALPTALPKLINPMLRTALPESGLETGHHLRIPFEYRLLNPPMPPFVSRFFLFWLLCVVSFHLSARSATSEPSATITTARQVLILPPEDAPPIETELPFSIQPSLPAETVSETRP